jgi:hypothetical protein
LAFQTITNLPFNITITYNRLQFKENYRYLSAIRNGINLSKFVSNAVSLKLILEECGMRVWIVFNWPEEGSDGGSPQAWNPVNRQMKYRSSKKGIYECYPREVTGN